MIITLVVLLVVVVLVALLAMRMPVALALAGSGLLGIVVLKGTDYATSVLGSVPFSSTASYSLTIIPMFILMGMVAMRARIAEQVFVIANRAAHRIPGGLGVATVMACAGFAAISGSSIGTAATMSKLAVGEMRQYGYPAALATGVVAIAGTLGVIIPPSTFLVIYAIMTGESIAQLLAAGIVPGLLSALGYIVYIMIVGHRRIRQLPASLEAGLVDATAEVAAKGSGRSSSEASDASSLPTPSRVTTDIALADRRRDGGAAGDAAAVTPLRSLPWRGLVWLLLLFGIVLGGMFSGLFTAIESAAMASFAALLILAFETRSGGLRAFWTAARSALLDTAQTTSMVFMILVGSTILSTFLVAAHVPDAISTWVSGLPLPPLLTMALLLLLLLPLGTALDEISVLIITIPIFYPVAMELGFDGVWLGIMIVKLTAIGMVTPPVGMTCFVVSGTSGVRIETVFKGVLPLMVMDLIVSAVLFLVPAITLFLPSLVKASAG